MNKAREFFQLTHTDSGLHERLYQTATTHFRSRRVGSEVLHEQEGIGSDQRGLSDSGAGLWASGRNESGLGGVDVFDLNGMVLRSYFNQILAQAKVKGGADFQGIMGLAEQVTSKLFLEDGVYSLWSRDVPSPVSTGKLPGSNLYGTHPFYMARATDDTWFGVYTNLAAVHFEMKEFDRVIELCD